MAEQNVWHNYQTKLLGGGLLLVGLIIIAAFLSYSNHTTSSKKEVVIAIQPQAALPNPTNPANYEKDLPSAPNMQSAVNPPDQDALAQPVATINSEPVEAIKPVIAEPAPKPATPVAVPQTKVVAIAKPIAAEKRQAKASVKNSPYTDTEKKLLATPKQHYTIQLTGASTNKNLHVFIKRHNLQTGAAYFQTYHNGKPWYVIVYGDYKTRAEAQAALQQLPSAIKAQHPWVRDYAGVHTLIQRKLS